MLINLVFMPGSKSLVILVINQLLEEHSNQDDEGQLAWSLILNSMTGSSGTWDLRL
jgi:hypothetical protein